MNGASKILTVSYGTFSCTLEGFDDPFNTMKAIAEYFRDLAAEDRYFGAEPPTPDAAMLHRIAEREIQRRVEAKIQENGVVLRASDGAAPLLPEAGGDAPPRVSVGVAAPVAAPVAAAAPAVAAVVTPAAAPPAPAVMPSVAAEAVPMAESVAAKLSRLRSEVAAQPGLVAPAATVPTVTFALPDYIEDDLSDAAVPAAAPAGVPDVALADSLPEDDLAGAVSAGPDGADLAMPADAEDDLIVALAADAAADDRPAPVLPEAVDTSDAAYSEDLPGSLMSALADGAGAAMEEQPADPAPVEAEDADDALRAALQQIDIAPLTASPDSAADMVEADRAEADGAADLMPELDMAAVALAAEEIVAPVAPLAEVVAQPAEIIAEEALIGGDAAPEAEAAPETLAATDAEVVADAGAAAPAQPAALDPRPEAVDKVQRARARVIRIRRTEADAAPAAEPAVESIFAEVAPAAEQAVESIFAEVAPAAAPVPAADVTAEPSVEASLDALLSAEDEAELERELAALRENGSDADTEAQEEVSSLVLTQDARRGFEGPSADEALGRLMQQTDSEMAGTETKRRQSAIQHLKAAVAATVAERKVTGEVAQDTVTVSRLARYRDDLARVVKSALPGRSEAAAGAPAGERPAPLVLVSEQRIDRPRPAPVAAPAAAPGPIRPRRVTTAAVGLRATAEAAQLGLDEEDEDLDDEPGAHAAPQGFAEFVEQVGAQSLEEILEASAAYLAGVEGRPQFSRPQLMRRVNSVVPGGTVQREDGLRSFGMLLRDGRLAKVRRGLFTLSDGSAYLAEARKIAG